MLVVIMFFLRGIGKCLALVWTRTGFILNLAVARVRDNEGAERAWRFRGLLLD